MSVSGFIHYIAKDASFMIICIVIASGEMFLKEWYALYLYVALYK